MDIVRKLSSKKFSTWLHKNIINSITQGDINAVDPTMKGNIVEASMNDKTVDPSMKGNIVEASMNDKIVDPPMKGMLWIH